MPSRHGGFDLEKVREGGLFLPSFRAVEGFPLNAMNRDEVEGVRVSARLMPYRGSRRVLALLRRNTP